LPLHPIHPIHLTHRTHPAATAAGAVAAISETECSFEQRRHGMSALEEQALQWRLCAFDELSLDQL
jgi:hypothetical protein